MLAMPHPHGLLLRSWRHRAAGCGVTTGVLIAALAGMVELGGDGVPPLQRRTTQVAAAPAGLAATAADDRLGNGSGRAREANAVAVAEQVADAGEDIVGSVRRKHGRKASLQHRAKAAKKAAAAKKAKLHAMFRQDAKDRKAGKHALEGIASFYSYDTQTASGEKFDPRAMVAAHRTLPFGTWIRVTDLDTAQSVTVRVNDRGPYIDGRIVDLTSAAAESLGITTRGLAKVKLELVEAPGNPVLVAQSSGLGSASCLDENPARPHSLMLVTERLSGSAESTQ
jgi:rare lipoprotein A